jgi:hypothetical protein
MKLMLPKEHGSWAVLIVPIAVGFVAVRGGPPLAELFFCCAALGAFLMRPPLQSLVSAKAEPGARESLYYYGVLALSGLLPLLGVYERWGLLVFALPAGVLMALDLYFHKGRRSFSAVSEIVGIAVLCLGAPAAFYAARGSLNQSAWAVWLLSVLFFSGPVFYVKMAALQHRASVDVTAARELSRRKRLSAAYHTAALFVAVAAVIRGLAPALAALPFAIALAKTLYRGSRPPAKVDFRRLGYQEVGYSVIFFLAFAAGLRL